MATLSSKTGLPSFSQSITEINYFSDGGFERGVNAATPVGWAQYQDAAAAAPVDGTGGTAVPTVTMLCSNSSPIRGTLSAIITKDAVNRQGVGYSYDFTISQADKGVTTGVSFEMQTSLNFASGDVVFYVYDVTNSLLITPRNTSLTKMDSYGKFFSDFALTSGTQYRFILHIASVNALAWTLKLDTMVNTTTKTAVPGAPVYIHERVNTFVIGAVTTPPTPQAATTYYRETVNNGDGTATIRYEVNQTSVGTAGSGDYLLPLPSGLTIDYTRTAKLGTGGTIGDCGKGSLLANATAYDATARTVNAGPYINKIYVSGINETTPIAIWGGAGLASFANGVIQLAITVRVAINEWAGSSANFIRPNVQSPIRAGTVQAFAGSVTPAGWLDCDGSSKIIIDYPELYAQIGTTWATCTNPLTGVANSAPAAGSFRVPDLRGVFIRGVGGPNVAAVTTTLAGYQADTFRDHSHSNFTAGVGDAGGNQRAGLTSAAASLVVTSGSVSASNGQGPETRPQNVGLRMIIKAWDESFNPVGFGAATATQQGLFPPLSSSMDDTLATRYGFKQYLGGTTYNSVALTVSGSDTFVNSRSVFVPYQMSDGTWRLKFNIRGTRAGGNTGSITIAGVVFKSGFSQAVSAAQNDSAANAVSYCITAVNTGVLSYGFTGGVTLIYFSGDVELESKPTWSF